MQAGAGFAESVRTSASGEAGGTSDMEGLPVKWQVGVPPAGW
jgi:hypothetical protein